MMEILFISYRSLADTRTNALYEVMCQLGNVTSVMHVEPSESVITRDNMYLHHEEGLGGILSFIKQCNNVAKEMGKVDILFIDNRKATLPGFLIRRKMQPCMLVQDVKEFYTLKEVKHLAGKIGCACEAAFMKRADVIICTNKFRAKAMREYHGLKEEPIIFENIFRLEYSQNFDFSEAERKYGNIFKNDKFHIISTAGCALERTTDKLVRAMAEFRDDSELILVGGGSEEDRKEIDTIVKELSLDNIYMIDRVNKDTLKWLISKCDAGAVIYNKKDQNNLFCASGKIYEFAFEGIPVICSDNPPLVELCETQKIGVASNDYVKAIRAFRQEYDKLKICTEHFKSSIDLSQDQQVIIDHTLYKYRQHTCNG